METSDFLILGAIALLLFQGNTQQMSSPSADLPSDEDPRSQEPDPATLPSVSQMRQNLLFRTKGKTYDKINMMPDQDLRDLYVGAIIFHGDPKFMPESVLIRFKAVVSKYDFEI